MLFVLKTELNFQVLELYPEFAESFSNNLEVTFNLRDVSRNQDRLIQNICGNSEPPASLRSCEAASTASETICSMLRRLTGG